MFINLFKLFLYDFIIHLRDRDYVEKIKQQLINNYEKIVV